MHVHLLVTVTSSTQCTPNVCLGRFAGAPPQRRSDITVSSQTHGSSGASSQALLHCKRTRYFPGRRMTRYAFRRRNDGIYLFDLGKTYEKMQLAARIIVAVENPQDILVVSARPYGQRAVIKYASYTQARVLAGRFTPGMQGIIHKTGRLLLKRLFVKLLWCALLCACMMMTGNLLFAW